MARKAKTPRWLSARRAAGKAAAEKPDWVARALARAGVMPLAQAEEAVKAGRVRLDGRVVKEPFAPLLPATKVTVDGAKVEVAPRTLVLAFHKPKGLVTSTVEADGASTVFEALLRGLPEALQQYGWHAVGRLDKDTTGLLLFTNDERFVAHATRPETHLPKRYVATVGAKVTQEKLETLRRGVELDDGVTRPAQARARGEKEVELVLTEGRWHQLKRMLGAVGLPVLALHREAVGECALDVAESEVRLLGDDEVERYFGYTPRQR